MFFGGGRKQSNTAPRPSLIVLIAVLDYCILSNLPKKTTKKQTKHLQPSSLIQLHLTVSEHNAYAREFPSKNLPKELPQKKTPQRDVYV